MRFMMIVKSTKESEAGQPPDPRMMEVVHQSAKELTQAGVMRARYGLVASSRTIPATCSGGICGLLTSILSATVSPRAASARSLS